ncbi:hypothetical protein ABIB99_005767 [Bradyrhizobium sp. LA6.1]|uniref:hypothetical protein n=1 Tax=Bradyrhizobium sp. LA6.1 TaxID=3156378 RepID=UPI003390B4D6
MELVRTMEHNLCTRTEDVQANALFYKARTSSLRCESRKYEQSDLAIQTIALMRIKTRHRDERISDALDATSQRQRFALPRFGASYSLLF